MGDNGRNSPAQIQTLKPMKIVLIADIADVRFDTEEGTMKPVINQLTMGGQFPDKTTKNVGSLAYASVANVDPKPRQHAPTTISLFHTNMKDLEEELYIRGIELRENDFAENTWDFRLRTALSAAAGVKRIG